MDNLNIANLKIEGLNRAIQRIDNKRLEITKDILKVHGAKDFDNGLSEAKIIIYEIQDEIEKELGL